MRRLLVLVSGMFLVIPTTTAGQSPAPSSPLGPTVYQGWPGARTNPAGRYSWTETSRSWMHKLPAGYPEEGAVEMTISALPDDAEDLPAVDISGGAGSALEEPATESPTLVADARVQAWVLGEQDARVIVTVKSFPNTRPELVAEAEAIIRSMYFVPTGSGPTQGRRVVFTLPDGWDSG